MARTFKTLMSVALLTVTATTFALTAPQNSQPINRIVAIVNNTPITQSQVNQLLQSAPKGVGPSEQMALQALINQTLQMDIAKKAGISVSAKDVDQALAGIAAQNHMTTTQMKSKVLQQMSWADYTKQIKTQVTMNKIQQEAVSGKVNVSNADIDAFIKDHSDQLGVQTKYQYSDLLVSTSDKVSSAQALVYAKTVIKGWKAGVNLSTLAQKLPVQANASMVLADQWQTPDNIPDVFLTALNTLKNGALSQPIVTGNGVHVLQLDKKNIASAAVQKQRAVQILSQQAFLKAVKNWVTSLKKSAYIKVFSSADNASV
jgi:peptidyl-prolyl cis-trans isomerase SurA